MIPDWLKCENCLFNDGLCRFKSPIYNPEDKTIGYWPVVDSSDYCSNWTCARCWQSWDEYFFPKDAEGLIADPQIYIDHEQCEQVEFGVRT